MNNLKRYKVTFTIVEKKEWKPKVTRTVEVDSEDEYRAMLTVADEFDSIKANHKINMWVPANRKIHIDKVEEIKEKKTKKDDKTT